MDGTPTTLLVADGDENTRAFLLDNLAADGYTPVGAQTEQETALKLSNHGPSLLVLGRLEAWQQTLALVRAIRSGEAGSDACLPVIVLGDSDSQLELLRAFEAGCDDFMSKPISYIELRARVRACIHRRWDPPASRRLAVGALVVDRDARRASHAGQELWLSPLEFDLLAHLAAEPTRVFTKPELLREVWRFSSRGPTRTLDTHACRLRKKLARAGAPHLIHNTRGVGYRLSMAEVPAHREPATIAAWRAGHAA